MDESKTVAVGFSYHKGAWRWKSNVNFGNHDYYHTVGKERSLYKREIKWLEKTLKNWIEYGKQTTKVTDDMWISKGMWREDMFDYGKDVQENSPRVDNFCAIL